MQFKLNSKLFAGTYLSLPKLNPSIWFCGSFSSSSSEGVAVSSPSASFGVESSWLLYSVLFSCSSTPYPDKRNLGLPLGYNTKDKNSFKCLGPQQPNFAIFCYCTFKTYSQQNIEAVILKVVHLQLNRGPQIFIWLMDFWRKLNSIYK